MSRLVELALGLDRPLALPILTYPGAHLAAATVRQLVTDPALQAAAQIALHRRFSTRVVLTAMDLSVEIEAFGGKPIFDEWEIPTVPGRLVADRSQADALTVPAVGAGRTGVYLETVARLKQLPDRPIVLAGMIGPFSLAARLYGVSETLGLTIEDPAFVRVLLEKSTAFLAAYAAAFKAAGADGVVMAEPTAGLLSPRAMAEFSSAWIKRIVGQVDDDSFTLVYHNCAARAVHLESVLVSGSRVIHFGVPMDMPGALARVPSNVIVCGNLDPTNVFFRGTPPNVAVAVRSLRAAVSEHRNFVLSSGCDIPPRTPIENIEAFFAAASG